MISLKTILIFHKNFLDFKLDMIEKHINLSSHSSKSYYASVVLCDSEVASLREGEEGAAYHPFLYCVFVYRHGCIIGEVCHQNFSFLYFRKYFVKACSFSAFKFFQYCINSSFVFTKKEFDAILKSVISGGFPRGFLKCSFHFCRLSSWLVAFSFALEVLSFHSLHLLSAMLIVIVYLLNF